MEPIRIGRRQIVQAMALLGATALSPATFLVRGALAASDRGHPLAVTSSQIQYFSRAEAAFLEAAVDRLIPPDENGPGARDAGVVLFLDRQMTGSYGRAGSWYMEAPFVSGSKQQGYQLPLTPAELYRKAIAAINVKCRKEYGGRLFHELSAEQQDEVLSGLEKGKIELGSVPGNTFFEILLENTVQGFFSDPLYGGNRGFAGWKLIGFPGPRYDYTDYIERYGERYPLPTVGILGRTYPPI